MWGWGGIPQAFDGSDEKWKTEYAELKGLLTPAEYEAAQRFDPKRPLHRTGHH